MEVLVTGGAGYIGSTVATALEAAGHTPIILDSLLNGRREFIGQRAFYEADISDRSALERLLGERPDVACTIHCAARIVVPESVREPYVYYRDNVAKSLELFNNLVDLGIPRIVFSSSASLYATVPGFEVREDSPLDPASPYARTKQVMEMALVDMSAATNLRAIVLRYFNPIGSDPELRSGIYDPLPSHVLGQLVAAARGDLKAFTITGVDFETRDGSGIRDYVHVWDLARAHGSSPWNKSNQALKRPRCLQHPARGPGAAGARCGSEKTLRQRGSATRRLGLCRSRPDAGLEANPRRRRQL